MSLPPTPPEPDDKPDAPPPPEARIVELETPSSGWRKLVARRGPSQLSVGGKEIVIEHSTHLRAPLILAPGGIAAAAIDPGPAKVDKSSSVGRFPILRRLSTTTVIPREEGIEGWLWTASGGSAFTVLGDEETAPNLALVFLQPLEEAHVIEVFEPDFLEDLAKRSPLGSPTVFGMLIRVADTEKARLAFQRVQLIKPLTDREVPPTQRRHLPTDKPANPTVTGTGDGGRAETSVPPPGMG